MDPPRDTDTARFRQSFPTRGDIHPIAEDVPFLHHHVADIDSNAELHATLSFQSTIRMSKFVLDLDSALDCCQGAAKRRKNTIASSPANPSVVLRNEAIRDQTKSG